MKLSVLITYHNEGVWLTECLRSVLPQLDQTDEVIIYDDASTKPAQPHVPDDQRVRVLRGESNIGPARARNELLAASTGDLIHFHDADDLFDPSWRSRVVQKFGPQTDVVFTDVQSFDDQGNRWPRVMGIARLSESGDLLGFALRGGVLVPAGTYRRAAIEKIGGYRAALWQSEDYDFHIRLALSNPRWAVLPEDLVLIRRHAHQRSHAVREVWTSAVESLEFLEAQFPDTARSTVAQAATRAGSALFAADAHDEAARAFRLAERFGGARYDRALMQNLTRLLGALSAEKVAAFYRKLVPNTVRTRLQKTGL
jgi:glycosyltransferase involved in cell wall biosynthesis